MHYFNQYKGLSKQVYLICFSRTLLGLGSMSNTLMPLHLRSLLGFDQVSIGLIVSTSSLMALFATLTGGRLADRIGRKKTCLISAIGACTSYLLSFFFCRHRIMALLMITNQTFLNLAYPAFNGMLGDRVKYTKLQVEAFSLLYLCSNIGFAIGPSIGGLLYYNHLELIFLLQFALTALAMTFFQLTTEEIYDPVLAREKAKEEMQMSGQTRDVSIIDIFRKNTALPVLFLTMAIVTMCYQMINFMLTMQMSDYFGDNIASKYSGFIWTVNCSCVVFITPLVVGFAKRHHQFFNMSIGLIFYALGFGSYAFLRLPWLFLLFAVIWSLGEIVISAGVGGFIASNSPPSHLSRCQSLYEASRYVGRTAGPTLFGYLLLFMDYSRAWIINGCICIMMSIFIFTMYKHYSKEAQNE